MIRKLIYSVFVICFRDRVTILFHDGKISIFYFIKVVHFLNIFKLIFILQWLKFSANIHRSINKVTVVILMFKMLYAY